MVKTAKKHILFYLKLFLYEYIIILKNLFCCHVEEKTFTI